MKGDRWLEGAEAMNIAWGTATPNPPASEFQFYPSWYYSCTTLSERDMCKTSAKVAPHINNRLYGINCSFSTKTPLLMFNNTTPISFSSEELDYSIGIAE